ARERRKRVRDRLVNLALERHDKVRQTLEALPAPFVELGVVRAAGRMADVDLAVRADEAKQEPFLRLPAIASAPAHARPFGQIVLEPGRQLRDQFDRAHAGLLPELALGRLERLFAGVDSSLRHLPGARIQDFRGALALAMAD